MDRGLARTTQLADGLYWVLAYGALWWLLTGGAGWLFGVPAILAATVLSLYLELSPWRLKLAHFPAFLFFFLHHVASGGWDVARRAVHPRMPLNPAWVDYSLQYEQPRVRLILSAMVGLFPGTLASQINRDRLHVHVLDSHQPWEHTVASLERHLARLLGASP